ncbi:MAG: hypothetical protein ABUL46_00075, partial [Chitinophaga rupis]
ISTIMYGLQGEIKVNGKTYNGLMPAHGTFLDDHAIASIATFVKNRLNKENVTVTSQDVTSIRALSGGKNPIMPAASKEVAPKGAPSKEAPFKKPASQKPASH